MRQRKRESAGHFFAVCNDACKIKLDSFKIVESTCLFLASITANHSRHDVDEVVICRFILGSHFFFFFFSSV